MFEVSQQQAGAYRSVWWKSPFHKPQYGGTSIDDEKTVVEFWSLTPAKLRAKPPEVDLEIKRRVDWPDKKSLAKLVWQKPLIHAQEIGMSDVAMRKHCV